MKNLNRFSWVFEEIFKELEEQESRGFKENTTVYEGLTKMNVFLVINILKVRGAKFLSFVRFRWLCP